MEKKQLPDGVTTYLADTKDIASYADASEAPRRNQRRLW